MKDFEIEKLKESGYVMQFKTIDRLAKYLNLTIDEVETVISMIKTNDDYWFNVLMTPFKNSVYISIELKNILTERTDELKNIFVLNYIASYKDVEKYGECELRENRLVKYLTCSQCGVVSDDVKRVIDPYQQDMFGKEEWVNLCPVCYQDSVLSI